MLEGLKWYLLCYSWYLYFSIYCLDLQWLYHFVKLFNELIFGFADFILFSTVLISILIFIIPSFIVSLSLICSFPSFWDGNVNHDSFFYYINWRYKFPSNTVLPTSCKSWYSYFHYHSVQNIFLISVLIFSLTMDYL